MDTPNSLSLPVVSDAPVEAEHAHGTDALGALLDAAQQSKDPAESGYGKTYWRSIEEKLQTAEYLESTKGEFPPGADLPPTGVMRRDFLGLLGASMALAGVGTACQTRPADEKILPYTKVPDSLSPGVPQHYASAMRADGLAAPLLVRAWEGRPTKVEGNPEHPASMGATLVHQQTWLMDLYNPQRARTVRQGSSPRAFRTFAEETTARLVQMQADGGARLRFLLEPSASPLLKSLQERIQQRFPNARFHTYSATSKASASEGARLAFGRPLHARYDFSKADVILSLESDFLQAGPESIRYMREFSDRRDPKVGELNRLYQVESTLTVTGGMADHRLRLRSQEVVGLGLAVAQALAGRAPALSAVAGAAGRFPLSEGARKWAEAAAADLARAGQRALVVAGERQPAAVHALAHALNEALGSVGTTVTFTAPLLNDVATGPESLRQLARDIEAGQVDTLVITAFNPVYSAPADLNLGELLKKVPNSIYTGLFDDHTSRVASWFLPAAHELEAWGDGRSFDGLHTLTQPLINPLWNGVSEPELLALFLSEPYRSSYQLLRDFLAQQSPGPGFEPTWEKMVQLGFAPNSALPTETASVQAQGVSQALGQLPAPKQGMELNFVSDYRLGDGRYFHNPYLQELADPITKLVWDNAAYVSPATAEKLGVKAGDVVELVYRGKTLEAPVWVQPGQADDSVTLPLGYGQEGFFKSFDITWAMDNTLQTVGVNANVLRHSDAFWFDGGLEVRPTRKEHQLVQTQTHWTMEDPVPAAVKGLVRKRPVALEQTVAEYAKHPGKPGEALKVIPAEANLLNDFPYPQQPAEGYRWGMAIDLSRCTGCSACVVACQVENNIPVVGKEQVNRGREMLWLRIDRYFSGELSEPEMITQPMMCVHCEKAPCEYVCPVNATVHSEEGLNLMVYNRCVGTRYCSNNCPYKVRRFNYLHYSTDKQATERMSMNPDVTVRARGVMEKCTYCVQRIERARISTRVAAAASGDKSRGFIQDGTLQTACQQVCPAEAIVFGTLSDPNAKVTQLHKDERHYKVLNELGTQPRTAHLLRLRNPNPALAGIKI